MTLPSSWALQIGLKAHLAADTRLTPLLGDPARIYDRIPRNALFPLLTIGQSRLRQVEGVDAAIEHDIRITALSRWGGRKEVRELTDILHATLHDQTFAVEGAQLVSCRFVFADILRPADPDTYQSVMRFRAVTEHLAEPA